MTRWAVDVTVAPVGLVTRGLVRAADIIVARVEVEACDPDGAAWSAWPECVLRWPTLRLVSVHRCKAIDGPGQTITPEPRRRR